MGDRSVLEPQQRACEDMDRRGSTTSNMVRQVLRVCQKIESQVSSLNRLEAENNRLTTSLNHVEANFLMLLRTSQVEIAKLKRSPQNVAKGCAQSNHRSRGISTLDPRRSIDHADLIECLHTPLNYKIATDSKHIPAPRCTGLRNAGRSFSSSSGSSSASSSSSSSSLSSSSASPCQKHPRSHQHRQPPPLSASTSRRPSALVSSTDSQSRKSRNHLSAESSHIHCRHHKPPECLVSKPRDSVPFESAFSSSTSKVKLGETKGMEKHLKPVMADASTGVEDGPASHLMRLVRASVRSAREHHSASVRLAPPTEGKYLDESEKAIVDAYYRAEEERCVSESKRPRSQSPKRSLPFSPTLFARRQMLKHNSLCSPNPPGSCNITATTTSASTSDLLSRNPATSKAPHGFTVNRTEAKLKKFESVPHPVSSAPATANASAPRTPEGEVKYVDTNGEVTEVEEKKRQQQMDARAEVVLTGGEREFGFDDEANRICVDSPRIEIEDDISEVDSRPDGDGVEAMSEGEVNDEEEEDTMEEEVRAERANNSNNGHRKVHRSARNPDQWFHHRTERGSALRNSPSKSIQHKPRHRVVASHERRCNINVVESPPSKRTRRRSDERESYTRFRNSPPRRPHKHSRASAPRPPASIACRRFLSTSGGAPAGL
ncbi:hypothetical protein TcWFU_008871 [Taenia crassiceps]|uniref:Shugoshin C-terminal domain-containing protein n=1 Tax=Taenia crassiceps TaxID=6207 RepID=A0ABR4QEJ2_9CEST